MINFSEALEQVKSGQPIARKGWNGKGQFVMIQRPTPESKMTLPYLYISTVEEDHVPWIASQTDLLASDWYVVINPYSEKK